MASEGRIADPGFGKAFGPERARIAVTARVLVAALGLAVLSLPLLVTDTIPRLFVVVLVLGFVVAPYMISVFMLGERPV